MKEVGIAFQPQFASFAWLLFAFLGERALSLTQLVMVFVLTAKERQ